jgi:hypothetical protein
MLSSLTFRLPIFFCDIRYQDGVVTTYPLDLRDPARDPGLQYTVFFSSYRNRISGHVAERLCKKTGSSCIFGYIIDRNVISTALPTFSRPPSSIKPNRKSPDSGLGLYKMAVAEKPEVLVSSII